MGSITYHHISENSKPSNFGMFGVPWMSGSLNGFNSLEHFSGKSCEFPMKCTCNYMKLHVINTSYYKYVQIIVLFHIISSNFKSIFILKTNCWKAFEKQAFVEFWRKPENLNEIVLCCWILKRRKSVPCQSCGSQACTCKILLRYSREGALQNWQKFTEV